MKKRFPTLKHLSEAGIITDNERVCIESLDEKCIQHPKYWMSLVWAGAVVTRAKKEGRIKDDFAFQTIIKEINKFRMGCGGLLDYDWISIPLVYTQVVTLAVYTFFLSSLMGRQFLDIEKGLEGHDVDLYIPVFTFLQFFFYMGWLKVAEVLINPFGEDDDDFEMNWLIDRNLQVAYLIVDEMHAEHPELVKDQYWEDGIPDELPYTIAAEECRPSEPWLGSTADVIVSEEQGEFVYMDKIEEDEESECDAELKQVTIEDVKPTEPVNIKNGNLISRGSTCTLQDSLGDRRESGHSMLALIKKVFQNPRTRSSSRLNVNGIGSVLSMNSKISNARPRRRRKSSRSEFYRSMSKASNMSHDNLSAGMSRIPTHEGNMFKMSDTSSVNSFNSDSDILTRTNSDAKVLFEVREMLKKDLNRYQENPSAAKTGENADEMDCKESQALWNSRQERNLIAKHKRKERAENLAQTVMLRKKLEQLQALQIQIMKALDEDHKHINQGDDCSLDAEEAVNLLEIKTNELKKSLHSRRVPKLDVNESDIDTDPPPSTPLHSLAETGLKPIKISRNQSFVSDLSNDKKICGSFTSPSSPVPKIALTSTETQLEATQGFPFQPVFVPISAAASNNSNLSHFGESNTSIDKEIFNNESFTGSSRDGKQEIILNTNFDTSNIINTKHYEEEDKLKEEGKVEDTVSDEYYAEGWDNLGTIQELPELGYQSDSSDTDLLIPKLKKKSPTGHASDVSEPTLETVVEDESS